MHTDVSILFRPVVASSVIAEEPLNSEVMDVGFVSRDAIIHLCLVVASSLVAEEPPRFDVVHMRAWCATLPLILAL